MILNFGRVHIIFDLFILRSIWGITYILRYNIFVISIIKPINYLRKYYRSNAPIYVVLPTNLDDGYVFIVRHTNYERLKCRQLKRFNIHVLYIIRYMHSVINLIIMNSTDAPDTLNIIIEKV